MEIRLVIAALVGFCSLISVFLWRSFLPSPRLPPGPRPLPIVGNVLMLRKHPSLHAFANHLKREYGPIVTLWMFSKPIVFISGPEIIQEAMITEGSIFTGRPQFPSTRYLNNGHRSMITGGGERHRFLRKLLVSGVLSNKRVAECRPIREQEVDILVQSLKMQKLGHDGNKEGTVGDFRSMFRFTICNLIVGILFGRRLHQQEYVKLDELMLQRIALSSGKPRDFMPWLAWLPDKQGVKLQQETRERTSQVVGPLIEERKEALQSGRTKRGTIVDTLLGLQGGEIQSPIEILDSDVELLCVEILNAGTDTTALNLEYCLANLINHPEIQDKLAQEISSVVGERVVIEDDIPHLPFLQAVVKETLRRHSPTPLAFPRVPLSATKISGYDIPAGTLVVQHIEGVSLSPQIWEDPLEFKPERFLNKTPDITGSTKVTLIPFGVGRRICPGIHIAFVHVEFILARLIQAFEWKSTTRGQLLDVSPSPKATAPMKYPLVANLQERLMVSLVAK